MEPIFLEFPAAISCAALAEDGVFAAGLEDGSCRFFLLPATRAYKAIRNLGQEISSISFPSVKGKQKTPLRHVWMAAGRDALLFDLSNDKLVMDRSDALKIIPILAPPDTDESEEDVLNEISLSPDYLAYTSDSGHIGVVDLVSGVVTPMRTGHTNIAAFISFIPDRPTEMVSGGYDCTLIHSDLRQRTVLSKLDMTLSTTPMDIASNNIALAPPFITSLAVSPAGIASCGTADGRLWIGLGGMKTDNSQVKKSAAKKRRRYWEGLKNEDETWSANGLANGPIVGVAFGPSMSTSGNDDVITTLYTSTLGGNITCHTLRRTSPTIPSTVSSAAAPVQNATANNMTLGATWNTSTRHIRKVNVLRLGTVLPPLQPASTSVSDGLQNLSLTEDQPSDTVWVIVGGVGEQGKGWIEIFRRGLVEESST